MSTMVEQKVAIFVLQVLSKQRDADPQNLLVIWSGKNVMANPCARSRPAIVCLETPVLEPTNTFT